MKNQTLVEARTRAGLTQREVARKAHITAKGYQNYELGLREPKVKAANRIAKALNSSSLELFGT